MDWDTLTSFTVTLDGQTYEIEKTTQAVEDEDGETSEETVYLLNGEELDSDSVEQLMSSLDAMESTGSVDNAAPGAQELRFTFHQDSESWPQVELVFYQYDSSTCPGEPQWRDPPAGGPGGCDRFGRTGGRTVAGMSLFPKPAGRRAAA